MGYVHHIYNPCEPTQRTTWQLTRPMTIRRFVSRHRALRRHTAVVRGADGRRRREFVRPTVITHNGLAVLRRDWGKTIIGPQDIVGLHTLPQGGGGSNPLTVVTAVAALAIAVVAPYLAPAVSAFFGLGLTAGSVGMSLLSAGIALGLNAVVYGLVSLFVQPPPAAPAGMAGSFGGTSAQSSPTYSLQAQGNSARLGQPIPELFGRHRVYPDYAHQPYQSFEGNEQYLHLLMVVTQGECTIHEVLVGDTPVASYPEITWQQVAPGAAIDTDLVDPMMLVSRDLADVELPGSEVGSPWNGPFTINPAGTAIDAVEFDYAASDGLYYANDSGGFDNRSIQLDFQLRPIDDTGAATGSWFLASSVSHTMGTRTPQRWTVRVDVTGGRYEARARRTNAKDTSARAGNTAVWIGLRGRQPGTRTYPGMTLLAVKARATGNLNGAASRQFNLVATRKLPTWNPTTGRMTTAVVETRNPCDAAAYVCLSENGGRLEEAQVDLAGIYAHKADFDTRDWTFDAVCDTSSTAWEILSRIGRCVVAQPVIQGPIVRLVRDLPATAPAALFTPRNMRRGIEIAYKFPDEKTADQVDVEYIEPRSWKPATVSATLPGSSAENPTTVQLFGCTKRAQAYYVGMMMARANKYRRRAVTIPTEAEGLLLLYGDPIRLAHDMPAWGQWAEVLDFDAGSRTLVLSEELDWSAPGAKCIALRTRAGEVAGPFAATAVAGNPFAVVIGGGDLPYIYVGGGEERTLAAFGTAETYAKPLRVIGVTIRDLDKAEVIAIDDDSRMYDAIGDAPGGDNPLGPPGPPVDVHITSNVANLNLRTLAGLNGYLRSNQTVTVTIDPGVEVYSAVAGVPAIVRGGFPLGFRPTLINLGTVSGAGGRGGDGATGNGQAGSAAIDTNNGPLTLDNRYGTLRGGGGGGGGGGNSAHAGAGGGGGGTGHNVAPGGLGYAPVGIGSPPGGSPGWPGYGTGPGAGGQGATATVMRDGGEGWTVFDHSCDAGDGGAGGDWGQPGAAGGTGTDYGSDPMAGGAAGASVAGSANVTWIGATGTLIGPLA